MNYYNECIISLIFNIILSICLLSPNFCMFIHKKWFTWKVNKKCFNCNKQYELVEESKQDCDICGKLLYNKN